MRGGYRRRKRPVVAGTRMGAGIALMLLAQCSPERQVLFGAGDGFGAGGGPAVGSAAVGGSNIGPDGSIAGTGGNPCPDAGGCPPSCDHGFGFNVHLHGGCAVCECVPISDCTSDRDCPAGSVCFAGVQCDDGCSSPECCDGNHCASASCLAPANVTCLAVGCPAGDVCLAACDSARCACDGTS